MNEFHAQITFENACLREGATPEQVRSPCRAASLVAVRVGVIRRLREMQWSYPMIGRHMHRDHTTIMHHARKHGIER